MTLVCVHGVGTVIRDHRKATPYVIEGCMVGEPFAKGGHQYLRGWSFVTRIDREDARWPRHEAPDPCPLCVVLRSETEVPDVSR